MNTDRTCRNAVIDLNDSTTKENFSVFFFFAEKILDEKRYRLLLGLFSAFILVHRGAITWLHERTGASPERIRTGRNEILNLDESLLDTRIRRKGGGRKPTEVHDPEICEAVDNLLNRSSYGNPQDATGRIYSTMSLRKMCGELTAIGKEICHQTILRIVRKLGFSQQMNRKAYQVGKPHKDRNEQFEIIDRVRKTADSFLLNPLLSMDAKAKVFFNRLWQRGKMWRHKGDPAKSMDHDYPEEGKKATPYGIYDVLKNYGYVSLGISHDTAQFAVEALRRWWYSVGQAGYTGAEKLIILCDGGGSNGSRLRLWKYELACLAQEIGLPIEVHHYPPGCSKHNLIEHRMFSMISKNWAGVAFDALDTVLEYIRSTTTNTGLKIDGELDSTEYETGITVDDKTFASIDICAGARLGQWNCTIRGFKPETDNEAIAA